MQDLDCRELLFLFSVLGGCVQTSGQPVGEKSDAGAKPGVNEARLALEVPPGLVVSVDGEARGGAPLGPLVVAPGKHALEVDGPCGKASATVEVAAGELTTVRAQDFAGLPVAQLRVTAKTLDGKPVNAVVRLGDSEVPGALGGAVAVPACKQRLHVAAEGLGGFIEDIELAAGKSYVRDVILAPGSDMVRIAGARFRMGPPGPDHYDPKFDDEQAYEDVEGWPHIKTYAVDVRTFDIDRSEVTAEQLHACYKAGFCVDDILLWGGMKKPTELESCTIEAYKKQRDPRPQRGKHPANCVAGWEAGKYCEWVGKRLATDVEWEFAARSRSSEYACSWGGGYSPKVKCERSGLRLDDGTREVCSFPKDDTDQGLCDMMGSVSEIVTRAALPGRPGLDDCKFGTVGRGGTWGANTAPFEGGQQCVDMTQSHRRGFRCARDVEVAPDQG